MRNALAVFRREFKSYFDTPVAYVFLVAFLALAGFLTFGVAGFYEARQADLAAFFVWHPWIYLLLVPASTMGLWADERRNGTAELLLTLPVTTFEVLAGKFLAAWSFLAIALSLTFPVALTAGYLGSPDWGAVACGYIGSFLLAGAAAAVGLFASTLSRSSVVGFVVSFALVFLLLIAGFDPVTGALAGWGIPMSVVDGIAGCSLLAHFESIRRGVVDLADVGYYLGAVALALAAAKAVVDGRRGASRSVAGLCILAVSLVSAVVMLSRLPLRCDMTEEGLYSLGDGSRSLLKQLDKDVTLKYYVSTGAADMPQFLKTYATRVEDLLDEYVRAANGRLTLEKYDPEPDTDAEDSARTYGVEPQTVKPFSPPVYFGLVAECGDREETLGVLTPRTEATLEYDITRLVTRVAWPERPVVGVMSSIEGARESWFAFTELAKDYEVRDIPSDAEEIDESVKTLVVLHPAGFTDKALYAIDQFVLRGGRLVACVDPLNYAEMAAKRNPMAGPEPSSLGKLFETWGVEFSSGKLTGDFAASTKLQTRAGVIDVPAWLTLGKDNMAKGELLVARTTEIEMPFAGAFSGDGVAEGLVFTPVMTTSADKSGEMSPAEFMSGGAESVHPDGRARVVAARLEGTFRTAFPQGPEGTNAVEGALSEGKSSVMLFADADFLSNDVCVQLLRTPFGNVAQLKNGNLALFSNVMEQFAGRPELIGLRSRGESARPFDVVDKLEAEANANGQREVESLQAKLRDAQHRVDELVKRSGGNERSLISAEVESARVKAQKDVEDANKQIRNLKKGLRSDIDRLGTRLKWLNIALVPFIVVLLGIVHGVRRTRRRK